MGYTPKHAKPGSPKDRDTAARDGATAGRRHGLFAIGEPSRGRHAAASGARQHGGTVAPGIRAAEAA